MNNNSIPIFRIFDEAKAQEFYLDYLGFEVSFEHRYEENTPLYMGITRNDCEIHLSEHVGDATPGSTVRIFEKKLTRFHESLTKKSYKYYSPSIQEQPWGSDMSVLDPFGNKLIFYTL
tara:strand:+ start:164 stop:517 length:354 start_codon:yes stop_codon:yes gene_type:complete